MIIAEFIRVEVYKYNYTTGNYALATTLTESSIISASGKRQCCADGTFEIGGVYAATFSMQAKIPGMTTFQVRGAKLKVFSKYNDACRQVAKHRDRNRPVGRKRNRIWRLAAISDRLHQYLYPVPDWRKRDAALESV